MEELVQKYRTQGRITHSAHGLRDRVPALHAELRQRTLRELLLHARIEHGGAIARWT